MRDPLPITKGRHQMENLLPLMEDRLLLMEGPLQIMENHLLMNVILPHMESPPQTVKDLPLLTQSRLLKRNRHRTVHPHQVKNPHLTVNHPQAIPPKE
jgi:hypothetical protein